MGNVTIQQFNGTHRELKNWTITGYPLTNYQHIREFILKTDSRGVSVSKTGQLVKGPVVFHAEFVIMNITIYDTYLDPTGWGKVMDQLKF